MVVRAWRAFWRFGRVALRSRPLFVYLDRTRRGSIFQGSRRVLEMMVPSTSAVKPRVGC